MSNLTEEPGIAAAPQAAVPPTPAFEFQGQDNRDPRRRQKALVAMGRRAIAPPEPFILMQDAAALLAEMLDTEASAVAELSADGESLRLRLVLSESDTAGPGALVHQVGSAGTDSLAGYVLQVAHPVVVLNLPEEKRFVDVFLRQHGIRSAVAVPLKLQDRAFGALVACSSEDCRFDDDDVLFVETIGHLVATTIARRQTEDSLAEQRRLAEGVLQTVDTPVLVLDTQWRILRSNAACERTSGFSLDDVRGRPIWSAFSLPEEAGVFERLFEKLKQGASPVEFENCLLTKHSQQRRIAWSCRAMVGGDGTLESIIATGIDVTKQREAEQKAAQAEREAEEARQAMASLMAASPDEAGESPSAPDSKAWPTDGAPAVDTFGRLPIPLNAERRQRPRRSYPYKQRIAPVVRGQLPRLDALEEVQCNDIAAGGFSFLYPKPPESDMLVAALGVPPKITYLIAQVCHITRKEKDGKRVFLVGCNYVGRASY